MKRWLTVLAVLPLLLTGCAEEIPEETSAPTTAATAAPTEPNPGLYDPNHPITQQSHGAIAAYPLDGSSYTMHLMGEKILLTSACEEGLRLMLVSGETCVKEAETVLPGLNQMTCDIWVRADKVAYYDPVAKELVMMDGRLREMERIDLPDEEYVSMVLDSGFTTMYYSVEERICALDLQTGVFRLLRQSQGQTPNILSLEADTLLQCWFEDQGTILYAFVSCQDGRTYYTGSDVRSLSYIDGNWLAVHTDGPVREYLYGNETDTWVFRPVAEEKLLYADLLSDSSILSIYEEKAGVQILERYDMQVNTRTASVTVKGISGLVCESVNSQGIWFVASDDGGGNDTLCRWNPELTPAEPADCLFTWYTEKNPDTQGLAECAAYAEKIGDTYGITVSLELPEALKKAYSCQEEYQVSAIWDALEELEHVLSQFNEDYYKRVFRVTESRSFTVSLVRSITAANGEPLPDGNGLQAWVEGDSYIVVPVGADTRSQLYHQLWHMTETYVLSRNSILDTWDRLNPEDFAYLESYVIDEAEITDSYLSGPLKAFIDAYSMTYPREDRARIMEYAMQAGNEGYFESNTMQAKLSSLCQSIRKAFKWEESKEIFPWEQYLKEPVKE